MAEPRKVEIAVCDRHGLRYNAAEERGCVRCRRESGAAAGGAPPAVGRGPSGVRAATEGASASTQLLLAALLVAGTGTMFWMAHRQVLESFGSVFGLGAEGPGAATDAMALEDDTGLEDDSTDGAEPAAYPPDTVAVGPAAQEQQMRELMRQMEADARVDAEDAERAAARAAERDPALYDAGDSGGDEGYDPDE